MLFDGSDAGRDLRHSYSNQAHRANRMIRLYKDQSPGSRMCNVALRVTWSCRVKTFGRRLRKIRTLHMMYFLDRAGDRAVPTMVVVGTEKCLVHRAAHKFINKQPVEHVP